MEDLNLGVTGGPSPESFCLALLRYLLEVCCPRVVRGGNTAPLRAKLRSNTSAGWRTGEIKKKETHFFVVHVALPLDVPGVFPFPPQLRPSLCVSYLRHNQLRMSPAETRLETFLLFRTSRVCRRRNDDQKPVKPSPLVERRPQRS